MNIRRRIGRTLTRVGSSLGLYKAFGGKRYYRVDQAFKKESEANKEADRLRSRGYNVRITHQLWDAPLHATSWGELDWIYILWKRRRKTGRQRY